MARGRYRPGEHLPVGALHVAVRDNIEDDEIVVETAYLPDPALWEPDFMTRKKRRK
jgi:hypothetical protein